MTLSVSGPDQRRFPILARGLRVGEVGYYQHTGLQWVGYQVDPCKRGNGYGVRSLLLLLFIMWMRGHQQAYASIRPWDQASRATADRAGFVEYRNSPHFIYLRKELAT